MKKLFSLLSIFAIVLSCSSDETSTPVTPPPAPIVKYTITLSAGEGGTVSTTGGEYEAGQTVNVTATPQGEYLFKDWSDGNTNATRTITVNSNSTLTANFEKKKYPLTVNIEGEGEVLEEIINSGRTTDYDSGTTVKLTAEQADEWLFTGWSGDIGDIDPTENPIQLSIIESKTVTATFEKKKYPLTVNIEGEGEVLEEIVNTGRTTDYDSGTTVKLTAVPAEGWEFVAWTGAIESTELEVQLLVSEAKEVSAEFKRIAFVSKSERFSIINETTSFFQNQKGFKRYIKTDDIIDDLNIDKDTGKEFWTSMATVAFTNDFNNDGFLDIYSFLYYFPENQKAGVNDYASQEGKHLLIGDYFSIDKTNRVVLNSTISHPSPGLNISDFDNNGFDDILVFADNQALNNYVEAENLGGSVSNQMIEGEILYNYGDFNFSAVKTGIKINSHDGGSTGDVDNDGDIDIIVGPIRNNLVRYPKLYRNNGFGEFTVEELFDSSLSDKYYIMRYFHMSLFDVNGDGFLDLIAGREIGDIEYENKDCCFEYTATDPVVFWGNGTGKYDINNKTILLTNTENYLTKGIILGSGYTDFDKDGDIDILVTATLNEPNGNLATSGYYQSYFIFLYENIGNKEFRDVTASKFEGNLEVNKNRFTDFYDFATGDFDNDGDYDIYPYGVGILNPQSNTPKYANGLYWENIGGKFVRREND
ncbi:MAG: Uncharacterised protein [SAR116 cluster bacterium]|nr:MAG: Uncharacterised protein [SAR116 cluster bacterium]